MELISIILPVHNGGVHFRECVLSILGQKFTNFKLYILDNFSNDENIEWVQTIDDSRVTVLETSKYLSIEENWLRILSIKKSKFMTIIGHDDVLEPFYLEEMIHLIEKFPDASLFQTGFKYIDSRGDFISDSRSLPEVLHGKDFLQLLLTHGLDTMGTGYMMRSIDYDRLGGISGSFPNLLFADHALWIDLSSISYMAYNPRFCFRYRIHSSTSARTNGFLYQRAFFHFLDFLSNFENRYPAAHEVIKNDIGSYVQYFCQSLSHRLLRLPLSDRNGLRVKAFREKCKLYLISKFQVEPNSLDSFLIKLAVFIDSNIFTRNLFIFYKRIILKFSNQQ